MSPEVYREEIARLEAEVAKWKEIAEENSGEHIRLEGLRDKMRALRDEWFDRARSSNDVTSPSIWVVCMEDLEQLEASLFAGEPHRCDHEENRRLRATIESLNKKMQDAWPKAQKWDAILAWLREREAGLPKL